MLGVGWGARGKGFRLFGPAQCQLLKSISYWGCNLANKAGEIVLKRACGRKGCLPTLYLQLPCQRWCICARKGGHQQGKTRYTLPRPLGPTPTPPAPLGAAHHHFAPSPSFSLGLWKPVQARKSKSDPVPERTSASQSESLPGVASSRSNCCSFCGESWELSSRTFAMLSLLIFV